VLYRRQASYRAAVAAAPDYAIARTNLGALLQVSIIGIWRGSSSTRFLRERRSAFGLGQV
jgi:hypothetical protein